MKIYSGFLPIILFLFFICCESENIEEKYYQQSVIVDPGDTTSTPEIIIPKGEIAWYPLNGNLNDSTGNNIPVVLVGDTNFVSGLSDEYGKGIFLDGASYLLINLGYYDTLSFVLWVKGAGEINGLNQPVLLDYGLNTLSAQLDGSSGATSIAIKKNSSIASSEESSIEYLNSFNKYSFFYFEGGGDLTNVYFKGYASDGTEIVYNEEFSFPGSINPQSEILYIGRSSQRENQQASYFHGAIDEIHIYSRSLTDQEIESFAFIHTN